MDPVSAHDVARELRRRQPGMGKAKLHKLLYYCQGWHLASTREPMFSEAIEAWSNGPVVASLWRAEDHGARTPPPQPLDRARLETIDAVMAQYGRVAGGTLIKLSHTEAPWKNATEAEDSQNDEVISQDALAAFFVSDAGAARLIRLREQAGLVSKNADHGARVERHRRRLLDPESLPEGLDRDGLKKLFDSTR